MRCGVVIRAVLLLLAVVPPTRVAWAETALDVDAGWGERARQGTWVPLYVKVSDPKPRSAVIQVIAPHDSSTAMRVHQGIALNPFPQTYELIAPLVGSYNEPIHVEVREVSSGKLLAEQIVYDSGMGEADPKHRTLFGDDSNRVLVGVSGKRGAALGQLEGNSAESPQLGYLDPVRLPAAAKGYDGIRALVLNEPDLTQLTGAQQTAIGDWVRAGGHLLMWPGEGPVPPSGPLVSLLPCRIGEVTAITFSNEELQRAGLPSRFEKFKARKLAPVKGAWQISLLGQKGPVAVRGRRGLGYVTVAAFNAAELQFDNSSDAQRFWGALFDLYRSGDSFRATAAGQRIDLLGDVPGIGTFGFKYVAMALLAMMAIVGPVDWFVLKWMGCPPWTWVTTAGWIGLIITSAIFVGSVFQSGDVHFRTLRVIDQADGAVIARTDVVGIYSPKTDDYKLEVRPGSWWEPMSGGEYSYGGNRVLKPISFSQNGRENVPDEMRINAGNLRYLIGETMEKGPAVIGASLKAAGESVAPPGASAKVARTRVTGTITNQGDVALTSLWMRTRAKTVELAQQPGFPGGGLAPGATLNVNVLLDDGTGPDFWTRANESNSVSLSARPRDTLELVRAAGELSSRRHDRVEGLLEHTGDVAVIYGESEAPVAAAKLAGGPAIEKHWQVLRAVVALRAAAAGD